jgi:hypothetical protein
MKELFELNLGSMTIHEYQRRFLEFLKCVSFIKDETVNIQNYFSGMPSFISDKIQYDYPKTMEDTISRTKSLYDQHNGRPTFQKSWEDKKKKNMEQRKEGTKTPFFINNPQGQPNSREPKTIETGGKRPRQPPIHFLCCKGDHMYIYCPHRGEKMIIVHNVQQVETVEGMGRSVPRIYAALDNTQA